MTDLSRQKRRELPDRFKEIEGERRRLLNEAIPENTKRAYRSDWNHFVDWCQENRLEPLPSDKQTVVLYLTDIKDDFKPSTIERRVTSISKIHQYAGYDSPTQNTDVRETLNAIKRVKRTKTDKKTPLLTEHIIQMCYTMGNRLIDIRDKSILLLGFASGMRRMEISGLNVDEVKVEEKGLRVTIRRSKTDQEGKGREVGISRGSSRQTDPVRAFNEWIAASGIESGPLFRSLDRHGNIKSKRLKPYSINRIVKKHAERIGLDKDTVGAHSLRSGLVTQSAMNGVSMLSIMNQTGHRSESVVKEYYEPAQIFDNNASSELGL